MGSLTVRLPDAAVAVIAQALARRASGKREAARQQLLAAARRRRAWAVVGVALLRAGMHRLEGGSDGSKTAG